MENVVLRRRSPFLIEIRIPFRPGVEHWHLLSSDHHFDSTHCLREKMLHHHKQAHERGATIQCHGDLFDVMQGRGDKRSSKSSLRPEYSSVNYYDDVIEDAVNFYGPFAKNYAMISPGNHEMSILKYHETNLTNRLVAGLNQSHGGNVIVGKYSGWIKFVFHKNKRAVKSFLGWYHHGYGGGGPVTKNVIQTNRQAVYLPQPTIIATGHVHENWMLPIMRSRISPKGIPFTEKQYHFSTAGYKEEYIDHSGWHIERGAPPKPTEGWWLHFKEHKGTIVVKPMETDDFY